MPLLYIQTTAHSLLILASIFAGGCASGPTTPPVLPADLHLFAASYEINPAAKILMKEEVFLSAGNKWRYEGRKPRGREIVIVSDGKSIEGRPHQDYIELYKARDPRPTLRRIYSALGNDSYQGREIVRARDCYQYMSKTALGRIRLWIDTESFLPRQLHNEAGHVILENRYVELPKEVATDATLFDTSDLNVRLLSLIQDDTFTR